MKKIFKIDKDALKKVVYHPDLSSSTSYVNSINEQHQSEGVVLHLADGSTFKTKEYTTEDIQNQLIDPERQWFQLDNDGAVNLKYVIRSYKQILKEVISMEFFKKEICPFCRNNPSTLNSRES